MAPHSASSASSSSSTFIPSLPATPQKHAFSKDPSSITIPGLPSNTYQVIAITQARIYHAELKTKSSEWTYSTLRGILVFGKDTDTSDTSPDEFNLERFWFRLINEETGQITWLLRLPSTFKYQVDRPFFHTFQARTRKYGFLLDQDDEAQTFFNLISSRTQPPPPPPSPPSTSPGSQLSRSLSLTRNRSLRAKKQSPPPSSSIPASVPTVPALPPPPPSLYPVSTHRHIPNSSFISVSTSISAPVSRSGSTAKSIKQTPHYRTRRQQELDQAQEEEELRQQKQLKQQQRRRGSSSDSSSSSSLSSSHSLSRSQTLNLNISAPRHGSLIHVSHVGVTQTGDIKASDNLDDKWRRGLEEYRSTRRAEALHDNEDGLEVPVAGSQPPSEPIPAPTSTPMTMPVTAPTTTATTTTSMKWSTTTNANASTAGVNDKSRHAVGSQFLERLKASGDRKHFNTNTGAGASGTLSASQRANPFSRSLGPGSLQMMEPVRFDPGAA